MFRVFFRIFLQFETKFHVNVLFVVHNLWHTLKKYFLSTVAHNQLTAQNKLKLVTHCY